MTWPQTAERSKVSRLVRSFLGIAPLLLVLSGTVNEIARAQALGAITGTITDASGAAVPKARVTAKEVGTGFERSIFSDDSGYYTVPSLRPTNYELTVEAPGFRKFIRSNITLIADQTASVQVVLEIGALTDSVTVSASASAVMVDVATPTLTDVVGTTRIEELPLNGRAVAQMINLVPGASGADPTVLTSQSSLPGSVSPSINGSRSNQTGYLLDGAPFLDQYYNTNIPFPFPDALQEFSVQTSNYTARYGGNAGGMVNVVTKSGTNSVHGGLFEFNRNQAYNARNGFTHALDVSNRNEYGGTLGGPVYLPKIYNGRDRTFFFFGYQGTRLIRTGLNATHVPTPAQLRGDFSNLLPGKKILDPTDLTGKTVFPNNQIPASRLDPASLNLATYLPPAIDGAGNAYSPTRQQQVVDQVVTRIDHSIGDKDRLAGRVFIDTIDLVPQYNPKNIIGYSLGYHIPAKNFMVQETHTFRPNLLNQASFVYSTVPIDKIAAANSPNPASFGVKNIWQPPTPVIQSISVNGYFSISGGAVGPFNAGSFSWQDDLTWIHGRHDLTFGGVIQKSRVDLGDLFQAPGVFTFSADQVNDALAAFMLGKLRTFTQGAGEFKNNRNLFPALYATDSFRATQRLTLSMGLRWEPYLPWNEIKGRVEQFSISNYEKGVKSQIFPNAPAGLLFPGDPGMPEKGTTGSMKLFSPRVGFAYALTNDRKTSIRGGGGMFYDAQTPGVINNRFVNVTPFSPQISVTPPIGPFSDPARGIANYPFPFTYPPAKDTVFPKPVGVVTYDPRTNYEVPVSYNWNLTLERQVAGDWLVQAAYVGSHASHGKTTVQLNPAQYIPGSTLGTDARRLFPGYGSISMAGMSGNSSYNSLQLAAKKRLSHGVNLSLAYTFSKSIDDYPEGGSNNDVGADGASVLPWYFSNGRLLDRGLSGTDHRHRLVLSYVWMLPKLSQMNRVLRGVFGEWQLGGILTAQSGSGLTITAGKDQSMTGLNRDRGYLNAGQEQYSSTGCGTTPGCTAWLNKAAFTLPATGTFGNLGKNALQGPGMVVIDANLSKNFSLNERWKIQLRGEFFNVLNHVNPNNPTLNLTSADFGLIRSVRDPRVGQVALKLSF